MKKTFKQHVNDTPAIIRGILVVTILSVICMGYGAYQYDKLTLSLSSMILDSASTTEILSNKLKTLSTELADAKNVNASLQTKLGGEVARNDFFNEQIRTISSTVGVLDKLSKTDKELLQKYSNVYFLNENYIPSALSQIDREYLNRKEKPEQIHMNVKPYLEALLASASTTGTQIQVLSAYRSFGTQANLKASYKIVYGAGTANKFSADQGYSEHQLGSTVDFTTPKGGEILEGFDKTTAYSWLLENAYKYGFIISYPKGNRFFAYEPWHFRFVGVELAAKLHGENKNFYDLDQREIDTYLVKIFD